MRLAVFASGQGSNLARIIAACRGGELSAEVALVVCNVPGAGAVAIAEDAGIPLLVADHRHYPSRELHERVIAQALRRAQVDLVVLAGYMRLISPYLLQATFDPDLGESRMVNIHPADPAQFRGPDGYGWAITTGQRQTAVTVHVVDEGMDTGRVILQEPVPVYADDTVETLRQRGLAVEHRLYPIAIEQTLRQIKERQPCAAS